MIEGDDFYWGADGALCVTRQGFEKLVRYKIQFAGPAAKKEK